ncbi:DUF3732 domain-containing protein [Rubrobacter radiotolerans]|uniref:DUF3732 domain-containing protein n=1 Tax=Rubrobacter radiotolerans TaxID=42256 RepID=A0AB35TB56_RUBRA|nr:DUF3732 domain-containing protein [Rubrobacter radiotolerans]MDX5895201.1 DUF3732 domain-containing protein [Rubrobacter radiotolerans]SMC07638.1 Protein of unknown function [Rubrobacter radiotolerans DSM 5868]
MQILEVVLYGKNGKKRTLAFKPGAVNVITGASSTGKSQIVRIVDYCFGSDNCNIARGPLRDKVEWYGLLLRTNQGKAFVGRRNPSGGARSTNETYFSGTGLRIASPETIESGNTNIGAAMLQLRDILGIEEYKFVPPEGQTRPPLEPTIRHALAFCLQQQTEVADDRELFHSQGNFWVAQAYKDLFPYFLGAIDAGRLGKEQEAKAIRSKVRRLRKEAKELQGIAGEGLGTGLRLFEEARQYGVVADNERPSNLEDLRERLDEIAGTWSPEDVPAARGNRIVALREQADALTEELGNLDNRRLAVMSYIGAFDGRAGALHRQHLRLESVNLFDSLEGTPCAICGDKLDEDGSVVRLMRSALNELGETLERAVAAKPQLADYLDKLDAERAELSNQRKETERTIKDLVRSDREARRMHDLSVQRSRVVGRISLWVETVSDLDDSARLLTELREAEAALEKVDEDLSADDEQARLESVLRRVSNEITRIAAALKLEHVIGADDQVNPVTLDIRNLTLIVDKPEGPVTFHEIGSGKNWLGFGIATHLALHRHFEAQERPVPNFLILDQPTQVFYPDERDKEPARSVDDLDDDDREEVRRLFEVIFEAVSRSNGRMQVIITDHADLPEERFQNAVVARWRGGDALVPNDW